MSANHQSKQERRHQRRAQHLVGLAFALAALAALAPAAEKRSANSTDEALTVFKRRILPIFRSRNPSSCTDCHLSGVELKDYIRPRSLYRIRGASMEPTLFDGDVLLVARASGGLVRGSLVVAWPSTVQRAAGTAQLKRIVGLPGEVIEFDEGSLLINGEMRPEPYLGGMPQVLGVEASRWHLGPGELFLLGDNRAHSDDSRSYGPVPAAAVEGVVRLRLWPPSRLGRLPRTS